MRLVDRGDAPPTGCLVAVGTGHEVVDVPAGREVVVDEGRRVGRRAPPPFLGDEPRPFEHGDVLLHRGEAAAPTCDNAVVAELEPGMRALDASVLIWRELAETVDDKLPGALAGTDIECLHDLRVAVRRTRSVLKEMRAVLAKGATAQARTDMRWVQEITGPTRDLDVQLDAWPSLVAAVPASTVDDLGPLHDVLVAHRRVAFELMCRRLRGHRHVDVWTAWRSVLGRPPAGADADVPVGELAGRRVRSVYRGMVKLGSSIDDASPSESLHDLRKRGKELRYLLELFGSLWPADAVEPLVSTLKRLQDVLGRFQDDEVQAAYLRGLGDELGGVASLRALETVVEGLAGDQRRARKAFGRRFEPFAARRTRKLVDEMTGAS